MAFLQSHVVPVVLVDVIGPQFVKIKELFGSAFFVDETVFVTARHVLEAATARSKETGLTYGLNQKYEEGKSPINITAKVVEYEFAPEPYDIAIGRSSYKTVTMFTMAPASPAEWQDVVAFGYPLSIVDWDAKHPAMIGMRCHKGYIQRIVPKGELKIGSAAPGYELNFNISRGLSGAPLFMSRHPKDVVIGVCVGSTRSELIDYENLHVENDGHILKESRLKIEEYGLAHDVISLHDWRPKLLGGKSLLESCQRE